MAISYDALIIAGAILIVAVVIFYAWARRNKEKQ